MNSDSVSLAEQIKAIELTHEPNKYSARDQTLIDIGAAGMRTAVLELLDGQSSPVFLPLAISLLNTVKAWRDCEGNDGFPHEVRDRIDGLLMAYEVRQRGTFAERVGRGDA